MTDQQRTTEAMFRFDLGYTPETLLVEDRLNPDYRREVAPRMTELMAEHAGVKS